jgi:hypothetical protein
MLVWTRQWRAGFLVGSSLLATLALLYGCAAGPQGGGTPGNPDPLQITTASALTSGQVGVAYSTTLSATGGTAPYSWSVGPGSLPNGLTLSKTGQITGSPTTNGSFSFTAKVTDAAAQNATGAFTLTISPAPLRISTSSLPNGQTGSNYSATLAATGGIMPYTWTLAGGSLPTGLSLNGSTGAITGTPSASVTNASLTFKVTDSESPAVSETAILALTISASPTVASVTLKPNSVLGGSTSQGTVTLSGPALSGGATVTLASSNTAAAQVQASVVVAAASTTATFTITTSAVTSSKSSIISASYNSSTQTATLTVTQVVTSVAVLTYHNDNQRTGQNVNETALTPSNVNSTQFGKLFSLPVDGQLFAQPLYVPSLTIGSQVHNVLFLATQHDSVYAWDADTASTTPLWQTSFINPTAGVTTVPCGEAASGDCSTIYPEFGITSTPVIDSSTGTLYVVAITKEVSGTTTSYVYRLHALNITTGAEKFGGPVVLQASASSSSGTVTFVPKQHMQRPGLLLANGVVYIGFGSHGDTDPWYGWLLGYNASTLQQVIALNTAPNGGGGAIWQSGCAPAADTSGNIYFITGNGAFTANTGGVDYGDTVVKLNSGGTVLDYFTPYNQAALDAADEDLGSGGLVLLPDQTGTYAHVLIGAGKQGVIYSVNRDGMGKYNTAGNQNIQSLIGLSGGGAFGSPAYWNGNIYYAAWNDNVRAFQVTNGTLALSSHSVITLAFPGATPSVSANGTSNGIVWVIQVNVPNDTVITSPPAAVLRAYDATNLDIELYDSTQAGTRDTAGGAVKFVVPTIANGKVYVGNSNQVTVYGLLP